MKENKKEYMIDQIGKDDYKNLFKTTNKNKKIFKLISDQTFQYIKFEPSENPFSFIYVR